MSFSTISPTCSFGTCDGCKSTSANLQTTRVRMFASCVFSISVSKYSKVRWTFVERPWM